MSMMRVPIVLLELGSLIVSSWNVWFYFQFYMRKRAVHNLIYLYISLILLYLFTMCLFFWFIYFFIYFCLQIIHVFVHFSPFYHCCLFICLFSFLPKKQRSYSKITMSNSIETGNHGNCLVAMATVWPPPHVLLWFVFNNTRPCLRAIGVRVLAMSVKCDQDKVDGSNWYRFHLLTGEKCSGSLSQVWNMWYRVTYLDGWRSYRTVSKMIFSRNGSLSW